MCKTYEGLGLDVHHLIYRNLYDVRRDDLRALCRRCHTICHEVEKVDPKLKKIKNIQLQWALVIKTARKWRKHAKKYGEENATAAMIIRLPYVQFCKRRDKRRRESKARRPLLRILQFRGYQFTDLRWREIIAEIEAA